MLHVHIERPGPRAEFIVRHLLSGMLGWEIRLWEDASAFAEVSGCKLHYGPERPGPDTYWVKCATPLDAEALNTVSVSEEPVFPEQCAVPAFDLFLVAFQLLSLKEEYHPSRTDEHDRMLSEDRWIVRNGMEDRPFLDEWAIRLGEALQRIWPNELPMDRRYRHWVTVDVDNGSRYKGLPMVRHLGATLRDLLRLRFRMLTARWSVVLGLLPDPYDRYQDIIRSATGIADRTIFFFLLRGGGRFDHAHASGSSWSRDRMRSVAAQAEVGVHPSYASSARAGLLEAECRLARSLSAASVSDSRQHFLRRQVPETFRRLIASGIKEEHSIGFRDRCGFLVGTCTPFPWFDLERNTTTELMLVPFACMDSALLDVQGRDRAGTVQDLCRMATAVKNVQGTFVSVWHDRHLGASGALDDLFYPVLQCAGP